MSALWRKLGVLIIVSFAVVGVWHMVSGVYIQVKAEFAQILLEDSWRKTLLGNRGSRPWPWADTWPVARMLVPRLDVDLIVLEGGSGRTLAFGPGRLSGSVVLGNRGVSVIGGHRDTHFAFLQRVILGDKILVENEHGKREQYVIEHIEISDIRHSKINLDSDDALIVLVTCYPFHELESGGSLRYVVVAAKSNGLSLLSSV